MLRWILLIRRCNQGVWRPPLCVSSLLLPVLASTALFWAFLCVSAPNSPRKWGTDKDLDHYYPKISAIKLFLKMLLRHKSGAALSWMLRYPFLTPMSLFLPAHCHSIYLLSPPGSDNTSWADKHLRIVTRGKTGLSEASPPLFPLKGCTHSHFRAVIKIPALHWGGDSRLGGSGTAWPSQTLTKPDQPNPRVENHNNHHITEDSAWKKYPK